MIHCTDFRVMRVQAAAFFTGECGRPADLLRRLPEEWIQFYDAEPITVPVPADFPTDAPIPGLILQKQDHTQSALVSRARIDLVATRDETSTVDLTPTTSALAERLVSFSESTDTRIGRLAIVVTRTAGTPQPGVVLSRQFCRDEWLEVPLNRPDGFELHAHKVFALSGGARVNSWIRIKTAKLGPAEYDHVLVEQDINTLAEELPVSVYERERIASWYQAVGMELDTILRQYFPT